MMIKEHVKEFVGGYFNSLNEGLTTPLFLYIIIVVRIYLMDQDKLKLIIRNLESLVECLKSEVYSDVDAYKAENYDDPAHYRITDYDEVFDDDGYPD